MWFLLPGGDAGSGFFLWGLVGDAVFFKGLDDGLLSLRSVGIEPSGDEVVDFGH